MHSSKLESGELSAGAEQNWYALFTRHQHEKSAALSLSSKGHDVYLPLYRSIRRWQDRSKQIWFPLFSCYLFVHGGMNRQVEILTTPGILQIVASGGRPAVVPNEQLDAIRKMIDCSFNVEPHPFLRSGDLIRVINGPLLGLEGILTRKKGSTHLVISMEMLGRAASVEVNRSDVERIGPFQASMLSKAISASA
ncbi:MAG TPA: UpxY family transcription antiterminator [Candidatus Acidoferrales bacterium]|nr:UpxY family transcription antiterminator [Candidatus Acidoferrales bacterium]